MVACLPQFNPRQEKFLDSLYRNFEENPIRNHFADWYAKKQEE
jgi:hypothetical protein